MTEPFTPDWTVPPGHHLAEILVERNIDPADFCTATGFSGEMLNQILTGERPITQVVADVIALHTGTTRQFWNEAERLFRSHLWKNWYAQQSRDQFAQHCGCGGSRDDAHHCLICHENTPGGDLSSIIDHIRLQHPEHYSEPEKWPDGTLVIRQDVENIGDILGDNVEATVVALTGPGITVHVAPQIDEDSWLNQDRFADFRTAYAYASCQTRAIEPLSRLDPEQAYWLYTILKRGHERQGH